MSGSIQILLDSRHPVSGIHALPTKKHPPPTRSFDFAQGVRPATGALTFRIRLQMTRGVPRTGISTSSAKRVRPHRFPGTKTSLQFQLYCQTLGKTKRALSNSICGIIGFRFRRIRRARRVRAARQDDLAEQAVLLRVDLQPLDQFQHREERHDDLDARRGAF